MSTNVKFLFPQTNRGRLHPPNFDTPILINGGHPAPYLNAPVVKEDAQFPMQNVLSPGRNGMVWRCPASPGSNFADGTSVVLEIDTGSNITPLAWGVLGYSSQGSNPSSVNLQWRNNPAYGPGTGDWFDLGPISLGANGVGSRGDRGALLVSPPSSRYWRWKFNFGGSSQAGFSLSGLFLQTAITDLGFLYSGADETRIIPRTVVESYARNPTITRVGPEFRRWSLRYDNNDAALRATFDSLFSYQASQEPFIFLTPDGEFYECVWDDESFTRSHIWAPPDRYAMTVALRSLT